MEAQFQKGRCPGCKATGTLLVESDHSIGCDSCEGLWEIEDLLRIIHQTQRAVRAYRHVAGESVVALTQLRETEVA